MGDDLTFELPAITDEDIRRASRLLQLPADAFHGKSGTDPRQNVLKSMERIDVAACPGSGKTTLLVAKLAVLAEKWQHRTRGICVLSHTNAARHEIEGRLGNTAAGQRLLAYPHFIGTIHAFINEFLAIPWLRSRGYPIVMVDTAICERRRWQRLSHNGRYALERRRMDESSLRIVDADFNVAKKSGEFPFADHTETYKNVQRACRQTTSDGYHCYDDMFIWARDLMAHIPTVALTLRERFPLLFIDEAQDNSEEQSAILRELFTAGDDPAMRQRLGDPNQAIFNFVGDEGATTDTFPEDSARKDLPNSHRFGQKIADLADPLGIIPYKLVGQGPKKCLASGDTEAPHTIFLFDDERAEAVLDAYADLLIETFSEGELRNGSFVAVGQVHRPPESEQDDKYPRHVGHYWRDYDAELTKIDPMPHSFVQYVLAGQGKAATVGEAHAVVERIAAGILRLARMVGGGATLRPRRHQHRQIMTLLEESPDARSCYLDVVASFALSKNAISKEAWDERWRATVRSVGEALANVTLSGDDVTSFLDWKESAGLSVLPCAAAKSSDNIYRYPHDAPKVHIRVGSIHSVKGETHTAALVLETFWYDHNLEKALPWFTGTRSGAGSAGARQSTRLKLHYVAMTRPTHLLCLAMKRSGLAGEDGELDGRAIGNLERRGWIVKVI